jgi:methylmalonyl-CoA mutase cobalamin-binding subunit
MNTTVNTRGTIVIGSTESDAHVVPIYLISLELENQGFVVENLRCFNSAAAFADAARRVKARAVVISNQNGQAYDDLAGLPEALGADNDIPVVLGGHYHVGVGDPAAAEAALATLGVTHFISSIEGLLEFLQGRP